jgi:hypothetical protein
MWERGPTAGQSRPDAAILDVADAPQSAIPCYNPISQTGRRAKYFYNSSLLAHECPLKPLLFRAPFANAKWRANHISTRN